MNLRVIVPPVVGEERVEWDEWDRIAAANRKQAMDWSLVLASQGIVAAIEYLPSTVGWGLRVEPKHAEEALRILKLYREETRRWMQSGSSMPISKEWFHEASFLWGIAISVVFYLSQAVPEVVKLGILDSTRVWSGEWWRLFTAMMLHADGGHWISNLGMGLIFFGLAFSRYGPGLGMLGTVLAGVYGNVFGLFYRMNDYKGLGASGMVMGGLGMLAIQALPEIKFLNFRARKQIYGGIFSGVMLFVLVGLNPESDVLVHIGGFLGGLAVGGIFSFVPVKSDVWRVWDQVLFWLTILGMAGFWWIAFHFKS